MFADGVGVKVAVAVDCGIGDAFGVTTDCEVQAVNNKIKIRISFFTKKNYSRRTISKMKTYLKLNVIANAEGASHSLRSL